MNCDNCDCNDCYRSPIKVGPAIQRIELTNWEAGILEITTGNTDGPR